jgi:hypothetical protein
MAIRREDSTTTIRALPNRDDLLAAYLTAVNRIDGSHRRRAAETRQEVTCRVLHLRKAAPVLPPQNEPAS